MNLLLSTLICMFLLNVIQWQATAKAELIDTEATLKVALNSGRPVLLEFRATWCPSCTKLAPTIKSLSKDKELSGRLCVIPVDVDTAPALARKYKIQSLPVLVLLDQSGKEIKRHYGYIEKDNLIKMLKGSFKSF